MKLLYTISFALGVFTGVAGSLIIKYLLNRKKTKLTKEEEELLFECFMGDTYEQWKSFKY